MIEIIFVWSFEKEVLPANLHESKQFIFKFNSFAEISSKNIRVKSRLLAGKILTSNYQTFMINSLVYLIAQFRSFVKAPFMPALQLNRLPPAIPFYIRWNTLCQQSLSNTVFEQYFSYFMPTCDEAATYFYVNT